MNAWQTREKEIEEEIQKVLKVSHTSNKETYWKGRFNEFQSCRQMHESQIKALLEEIEKIKENIGRADMLYSKSQNKLIEVWPIEGCAVFDAFEKDLQALKKKYCSESNKNEAGKV